MNKKEFNDLKRLYNSGRERLTGGDEQADTEINQIANKALCDKYEEIVQDNGFTLLIHAIREFYKQFGTMNYIDFAYNLQTMLATMSIGRRSEIDDGEAARAFLKSEYGYTDL